MASWPLKPGEELELEKRASFNNREGTLGLTNLHVIFKAGGQHRAVPLARISGMIRSFHRP